MESNVITLAQLQQHKSASDAWIALHGKGNVDVLSMRKMQAHMSLNSI
jgi:hypothetical protein